MVGLVALRIKEAEIGDGPIEDIAGPHIAGDHRRIARARVGARQRAAAQPRIVGQSLAFGDFADRAEAAVFEDADNIAVLTCRSGSS